MIMAGHTFLKENQNVGWEPFAKDHLLGFAWKMTMLLAFPANRQIYDSPCTLAIKWEIQKWQQNLLRYFFEWKKKENALLFDQTIHWRWREESAEHALHWFRLWNSGNMPRLEMGKEMAIRTKNEGIKNPWLYIASSKNQDRQIFNEIAPARLIKKSLSLFLHICIHTWMYFLLVK